MPISRVDIALTFCHICGWWNAAHLSKRSWRVTRSKPCLRPLYYKRWLSFIKKTKKNSRMVIKAFVCLSSLLTSGHLQDGFFCDEDARRWVHPREAHRQDLQADGHKSRRWVAATTLLRLQSARPSTPTWCENWQSAVRSCPAAVAHRLNSSSEALPGVGCKRSCAVGIRESSAGFIKEWIRKSTFSLAYHSLIEIELVTFCPWKYLWMFAEGKKTPLACLFTCKARPYSY